MEMSAAGNVEQQPVRRIEPDQGRVASTAIGEPLQPGGVGMLVQFMGRDLGHPGPGIGQRHARRQAQSQRRSVGGSNAQCALHLDGEDKRRILWARLRPRFGDRRDPPRRDPQPLRRQKGEP
jgi:hypothetical protein